MKCTQCQVCGANIYWLKRGAEWVPVDSQGYPRSLTCPKRKTQPVKKG